MVPLILIVISNPLIKESIDIPKVIQVDAVIFMSLMNNACLSSWVYIEYIIGILVEMRVINALCILFHECIMGVG